MRVCQFRHFGTVLASGLNQSGSKFEFRKSEGRCQAKFRPECDQLYVGRMQLSEKLCLT